MGQSYQKRTMQTIQHYTAYTHGSSQFVQILFAFFLFLSLYFSR